MLIVSWNVNSLRNAELHVIDFIKEYQPEIMFIQELRAHEDQLSFFLKFIEGYSYLFNDSGRPGYSGTALYYQNSLDIEELTTESEYEHISMEGRYIKLKTNGIEFHNFYVPNGNSNEDRYKLKLAFHDSMAQIAKHGIENNIPTIMTGDLNVCHTENDIYDIRTTLSCFRPEERNWFSSVLDIGYIDAFRKFNPEGKFYSWWNLYDKQRRQNQGQRLDYFFVSKNLDDRLVSSEILKVVFGSDHCPITCEIIEE